jgi:hypothetical protein
MLTHGGSVAHSSERNTDLCGRYFCVETSLDTARTSAYATLHVAVFAKVASSCRGMTIQQFAIRSLPKQGASFRPLPTLRRGMEGQRFGAYQVIREIGRGGMGAVYLAGRADGSTNAWR